VRYQEKEGKREECLETSFGLFEEASSVCFEATAFDGGRSL
jgi:hypothetical protein